jgi:1-acyl-sn-glycerol-3-phosphate acyltransferase
MPDNKKRFSFTFFSGGPGKTRIKIHAPIQTKTLSFKDAKALNSEVRAIILKALEKAS